MEEANTYIRIRGLRKVYQMGHTKVHALAGVDLDIPRGSFTVLMGPSGSGKSTLLYLLGGLDRPTSGKIQVGEQDLNSMDENTLAVYRRRTLGFIFQQFNLVSSMNTLENISFPMRFNGSSSKLRHKRAAHLLEQLGMEKYSRHRPTEMSGGQQQRVAIARVLVMEPRVLLLDEPFNALDAKLRGTMQVELRQLIKRLGLTSIFVTHDQEEALTMSDRIAVMRSGRIEQAATPDEIFDRPATAYVADFIGISNFWPARAEGGQVALPDGQVVETGFDGAVRVMARPHNLQLELAASGPWQGTVSFHRSVGPLVEYHVETGDGTTVKVAAMRHERNRVIGDRATVSIRIVDPALCAIYPG
jgi:ABC-type Fe3+/spermidine/putrescine transport system ATPase subunit